MNDLTSPVSSWKDQAPRTIILAACSIAAEAWKLQGFDRNLIKQMIFDAARLYVNTHRESSMRSLLFGQENQADFGFCSRFADELSRSPNRANEFIQVLARYAMR